MKDLAVDVAGAVRRAQAHVDDGDLHAALSVLRPVLTAAPLDATTPDPDVADAARIAAGALTSLGETYSALIYSDYAHRAAAVLDKPTSLRALRANLVHAFVLRATMHLTEAVELYHDVVRHLAERFGSIGRPTLAAQADHAVALHAAGQCSEATGLLHRTYFAHREAFGADDPQGIRMLTKLGTMNLDCGEFERAHQYFDAAKALCSEHLRLPATDPLARQVVTAARASSNADHVCGRPAESQAGLHVRDLFVSSVDLDVRDLVASALDVDATDPFVSALELITSGAPVSLVADPALAQDASLVTSSVLGHIGGHLNIDGSGSYPFTIDATVGSRLGLSYVQIRIFAPGADPRELAA